MKIIKAINLTVAFFLELAMIVAFGYFGFHYPKIILIKYILVILLPVIAMALWGYFAAPKSQHQFQQPQRYFFALVAMFGAATALLFLTGNSTLALAFGILAVVNQTLLLILKQ